MHPAHQITDVNAHAVGTELRDFQAPGGGFIVHWIRKPNGRRSR
jgi:hypothetical protein